MNASALLAALTQASLLLTCALVPALAVRLPLRRLCGAGIAYRAWLLPPAVLLAYAFPAQPAHVVLATAHWLPAGVALPAAPMPTPGWTVPLMLLWMTGAALYAVLVWRRHAFFLRALGPLEHWRGPVRASRHADGPMLLGLWRPTIVVPAHFTRLHAAHQRRLLVAHERCHRRGGDSAVNVGVAALQCVFWFHPLLHAAAALLRRDQELACDDAVLHRFPRSRRRYGELLLSGHAPPYASLTPHWFSHPLKERVMELKRRPPLSRAAGRALAAALIGIATAGAWAMQPAAGDTYDIALTLQAGDASAAPKLKVRAGEPFAVAIGEGEQRWSAASTLVARDDGTVDLRFTLKHGTQVVGEPRVVTRLGENAAVRVDDAYRLGVTVTRAQ